MANRETGFTITSYAKASVLGNDDKVQLDLGRFVADVAAEHKSLSALISHLKCRIV